MIWQIENHTCTDLLVGEQRSDNLVINKNNATERNGRVPFADDYLIDVSHTLSTQQHSYINSKGY